MVYDLSNPGTVISAELTYRPRSSWAIALGADVLSSYMDPASPDFIKVKLRRVANCAVGLARDDLFVGVGGSRWRLRTLELVVEGG